MVVEGRHNVVGTMDASPLGVRVVGFPRSQDIPFAAGCWVCFSFVILCLQLLKQECLAYVIFGLNPVIYCRLLQPAGIRTWMESRLPFVGNFGMIDPTRIQQNLEQEGLKTLSIASLSTVPDLFLVYTS